MSMEFGVTPFLPSPSSILVSAGSGAYRLPLRGGPGSIAKSPYCSYRVFVIGTGVGYLSFANDTGTLSGRVQASGAQAAATDATAYQFRPTTDIMSGKPSGTGASSFASGAQNTITGSGTGSGAIQSGSGGTGAVSGIPSAGAGIPFSLGDAGGTGATGGQSGTGFPGNSIPVQAGFPPEVFWFREGSYVSLTGTGLTAYITAGDGLAS